MRCAGAVYGAAARCRRERRGGENGTTRVRVIGWNLCAQCVSLWWDFHGGRCTRLVPILTCAQVCSTVAAEWPLPWRLSSPCGSYDFGSVCSARWRADASEWVLASRGMYVPSYCTVYCTVYGTALCTVRVVRFRREDLTLQYLTSPDALCPGRQQTGAGRRCNHRSEPGRGATQ